MLSCPSSQESKRRTFYSDVWEWEVCTNSPLFLQQHISRSSIIFPGVQSMLRSHNIYNHLTRGLLSKTLAEIMLTWEEDWNNNFMLFKSEEHVTLWEILISVPGISCTSLRRIVACASSFGRRISRPSVFAADKYMDEVLATFHTFAITKWNIRTHLPHYSQRALHPPVCYLAANRLSCPILTTAMYIRSVQWFDSEKPVKLCKISCQLEWMLSLYCGRVIHFRWNRLTWLRFPEVYQVGSTEGKNGNSFHA